MPDEVITGLVRNSGGAGSAAVFLSARVLHLDDFLAGRIILRDASPLAMLLRMRSSIPDPHGEERDKVARLEPCGRWAE